MFGIDDIRKQIQDQLNDGSVIIPDGHTKAFVTSFDGSGIHAAVAVKVKDNWELSGAMSYTPVTGDYKVGAKVSWSK